MLLSDALQRFCFECRSSLQRLRREEDGATALMTALAMIVLVGFVGLGTEVGLWYAERRAMQTAADAAAMGGAFEIYKSGKEAPDEEIASAAKEDSKRNGFEDTVNNVAVLVARPPTAGKYTSRDTAVEAVVTKQRKSLLGSFFIGDSVNIKVRSVATVQIVRPYCLLALAPEGQSALFFGGTSNVLLKNCGINVNSNHKDSALTATGASVVGATFADIVGGLNTNGAAQLDIEDITEGADAVDDPYAHLDIPDYDTVCDYSNVKVKPNKTETLTPGTYCGGIEVQSNGTANFAAGNYVIIGGLLVQGTATFGAGNYIIVGDDFDVRAGAVVTTDTVNGVTFFLTGNGNDYATVNINGGATVSVSAATSGTYQGIAFFQDRNAPNGGSGNNFNGGSKLNITGALYFPNQLVTYNGGNTTNGSCTRVVAFNISITGEAGLNTECGHGFGTTQIYAPALAE
ncbi:pilus assembly protein TadG-related protein [Dongia deserti]|uniref:pilus assembly protein TadG-related protein n=1 Tax=Dongia deserti TaxID=2268030 RepID=UPI000E654825|nr:pilus assembly protein TadG-related protein [Dongia deserti]